MAAGDDASSSQKTSPIAAAALVVATAAGALGFVAGVLASRGWPLRKARRRRDEICQCGAILPHTCTAEELARHKTSVRHRKNLHQLSNAPQVVVCEEVGEYRSAAVGLVNAKDNVLEVGCHVGGTSKVIAGLCRKFVGIDRQPDLVAQARKNLPDHQFEIIDAFDAQKILALAQTMKPARFTKVFVDISGSRELSTVVRLMGVYENALRPDVLIVKSQPLKRLLLRARLWINHPACIGYVEPEP
mmetsp:Transcript_31732/g.62349  ORF Transcript_31732/g.62349 Transcript_31732/m.62349 type:complete len:245 (+) Transcript_31732:57-791(+)|eukprot:CAMPEP_0172689932 /NCGR_PEP_ID=MMETSP1074-20121228/23497_1 /TAXON_ID=2916 /ORGANISM="Ceratium fusus, Strain PA161109" /LENGTH=244 /DNA_ID=CAMNT_0013509815 /DNA_START=55 /DNA_END=789 /DNA_ORIENTATION=-